MKTDYLTLMQEYPSWFTNPPSGKCFFIVTDPDKIKEAEDELHTNLGVIYRDHYIILLKDLVIFPDGKVGTYIRIMPATKREGVVILPVLNDRFVLIRHYRHSTREVYLEIPRGFANDDLTIEDNAAQEMVEETGYKIRNLKRLGKIAPDTGLLGSQACVYLAYLENEEKHEATDTAEAINNMEFYTIDEIKHQIAAGEITDGYTLGALALYWAIY